MKKIIILTTALAGLGQAAFAEGEVNVVSWGGAYERSQVEAYNKPFADQTGIRVNMIVFVMFFYAVMTDGRAGHPLIYLPLLYLSYKSFDFVANIMEFGQGFG